MVLRTHRGHSPAVSAGSQAPQDPGVSCQESRGSRVSVHAARGAHGRQGGEIRNRNRNRDADRTRRYDGGRGWHGIHYFFGSKLNVTVGPVGPGKPASADGRGQHT